MLQTWPGAKGSVVLVLARVWRLATVRAVDNNSSSSRWSRVNSRKWEITPRRNWACQIEAAYRQQPRSHLVQCACYPNVAFRRAPFAKGEWNLLFTYSALCIPQNRPKSSCHCRLLIRAHTRTQCYVPNTHTYSGSLLGHESFFVCVRALPRLFLICTHVKRK